MAKENLKGNEWCLHPSQDSFSHIEVVSSRMVEETRVSKKITFNGKTDIISHTKICLSGIGTTVMRGAAIGNLPL